MARYDDLVVILKDILGSDNVYFQPPENFKMKYPCIRVSIGGIDVKYANNRKYLNTNRYQLMVIDYDPDSEIPKKLLELPYSDLERPTYPADGLNHTVISLYY